MKQDVKGIEVTKEWLQVQLNINKEKVIGRSLMAIYKRQTADEQSNQRTKFNNGIGFAKPDARIGGIGARQYMNGGKLEPWVIEIWMRLAKDGYPRICKYASQLNDIAEQRRVEKLVELNRAGLTRIANDLATIGKVGYQAGLQDQHGIYTDGNLRA